MRIRILSGGWLLACHVAYGQGLILHVLWVPVGVSILFVSCIAANYFRAAADMVEGSRALSRRLEEQYGCAVSFGVGVHVGDAVGGTSARRSAWITPPSATR